MASGIVQVPADSVGKKIDTSELTVGANTVERQRVVIADSTGATNLAAVTSGGALTVDGSAVTQPVSGTVTANAGTGTLVVRPSDGTNPITQTYDLDSGAGAEYALGVGLRKVKSGGSVEAGTSTDPLRVDPTGTTVQPVSGTVTANLGTIAGVSTAAKQPALGTAGSASSDVITVQGVASMTKLLVTPDLPSGASTAAKQPALGTAGSASTDVISIQGIASMTKLLVTPDSVALPANQSVNVAQINGVTPLMGGGNTGTGSPRVTVATDQAAVAGFGVAATGAAVPANASYQGFDAATALPTAATAGNIVGAMADKYGRLVTVPCTVRDLVGTQTTTISASTSETTIVTAAASVFNDLVMLIVSNTSASTNTRIDFRDTTAGTILFSLFSVGGAAPVGFSLPVPIPQTTVNTNWTAQCATSTTDVRIYAVFAKNR